MGGGGGGRDVVTDFERYVNWCSNINVFHDMCATESEEDKVFQSGMRPLEFLFAVRYNLQQPVCDSDGLGQGQTEQWWLYGTGEM